jgi:two-component sensor histidine kinase
VAERRTVRLEWQESGGPRVVQPVQRGFGTRFIERVLATQAGGSATVAFAPDGVHCVFEAEARTGAVPGWRKGGVVEPLDRLADA